MTDIVNRAGGALLASDGPRSLFDAPDPPRYMSREDCQRLFERVLKLTSGGGETTAYIDSRWTGNLRWARNRVTTAGDTRNNTIRITREINGAGATMGTNKFDDDSLKLTIESAERIIQYNSERPDAPLPPKQQQYLQPKLWSDASHTLDSHSRSSVARGLVQPAAARHLVSAGYIQADALTRSVLNTRAMDAYYPATRAEYSVTVRNPTGTGSGWAGVDYNDWAKIDANAISQRALQKCVDSADPRAIEPGRYTVILEPQAVHDLFVSAIYALDRLPAEMFMTVYTLRPGQSKIGLKILSEEITVSTDPMDPEAGYIPFDQSGMPYKATTWISNGVLKELAYDRGYALAALGYGAPQPNPRAYRMSGGKTSIEEMIATTERGLLVTRLSGVHVLDAPSLLSSGTTRDGLWLIERGKIKYPVKNMRFTDSPMFAFNSVMQMGVPTRVFADYPTVVPAIKARDFNFSMLADAV